MDQSAECAAARIVQCDARPSRLAHSTLGETVMSETSSTLSRRTVLAASAAASAVNLLPGGAAAAADNTNERTAIRPFSFHAPDAELVELRKRINATKWPDREQ